MSQTNEDIKQDFDHLCKEILLATADKKNIKMITKAMIDSGQQDYMRDEFKRIGEILSKR